MFEPLKYGLPFAAMQYVLLVIQSIYSLDQWTLERWIVGTSLSVLATLLLYRNKSSAGFTFRIAWFAGFNVLVASTIGFCGLHFLLSKMIIPSMSDLNGREVVYVAFQEFYGLMTFGLISLTIFSALLRDTK